MFQALVGGLNNIKYCPQGKFWVVITQSMMSVGLANSVRTDYGAINREELSKVLLQFLNN